MSPTAPIAERAAADGGGGEGRGGGGRAGRSDVGEAAGRRQQVVSGGGERIRWGVRWRR